MKYIKYWMPVTACQSPNPKPKFWQCLEIKIKLWCIPTTRLSYCLPISQSAQKQCHPLSHWKFLNMTCSCAYEKPANFIFGVNKQLVVHYHRPLDQSRSNLDLNIAFQSQYGKRVVLPLSVCPRKNCTIYHLYFAQIGDSSKCQDSANGAIALVSARRDLIECTVHTNTHLIKRPVLHCTYGTNTRMRT